MARRYGPDIRAYIEKHCGEGSLDWMRGELREQFGVAMTYQQIKTYYANHKFHAKRGAANRGQKTFAPEVAKFVEENCRGRSYSDMVELLRKNFGIEKTPKQIKSYYHNNKLRTGMTGKFTKGHAPANKGKKLPPEIREKLKPTQFKPGHRPINAQPVGAESKIDGYWRVKIAEPNRWQLKSRHEWERIHGEKLKPDDVILFLDNNPDNFEPDNLVKITRADLARVNQDRLRGDNPDLNMAAVNLARLKTKAKEKQRRVKDGREQTDEDHGSGRRRVNHGGGCGEGEEDSKGKAGGDQQGTAPHPGRPGKICQGKDQGKK